MKDFFPRPTIRCMNEDLGMKTPNAKQVNFSDLDIPLLAVLESQMRAIADGNHLRRIVSIDDNHLYRLKFSERVRGASWFMDMDINLGWLVASGNREEGSLTDFYSKIKSERRLKNKRLSDSGYKPNCKTDSSYLLPKEEDFLCLQVNINYSNLIEISNSLRSIKNEVATNGGTRSFEFFGDVNLCGKVSYSPSHNEVDLILEISSSNSNFLASVLKLFRPEASIDEWDVTYSYSKTQMKYTCYTIWN